MKRTPTFLIPPMLVTLFIAFVAWGIFSPTVVSAADIIVDTFTDGNDGECAIDCTLREAISLAASGDVIVLGAGTYDVTDGVIAIGTNLTVRGVSSATTTIDGNAANALFSINGPDVTIESVHITNGANTSGGAVSVSGSSHLVVSDTTFTANIASTSGGAIYINSGSAELNNSTFDGNSSVDGGAVYVNGLNDVLTSTNTDFSNNITSDDGGAVFLRRGEYTFNGGEFFNNTADAGAAIYSERIVNMIDGNIISNTATSGSSYGAAVYLFNGATFTMSNGLMMSNTTNTSNNQFPGGAIAVVASNAYLNGGEIKYNLAYRGAGVMVGSGAVYLNATSVISNASNYGGGFYLRSSGAYLVQTGGEISHNYAWAPTQYGGGGIYIFQGHYIATGGQMNYNSAENNAGGIHVTVGTADIDGLTMIGNSANSVGGAVFVGVSALGQLTMTNSTLSNNTPEAIALSETSFGSTGSAYIYGNNFSDNALPIVYNNGTLTAFANNFSNYTTGLSGVGDLSTEYVRHNFWGDSATSTDIGNTEAFTYRLGSMVDSVSINGALADSVNGRNATIAPTTGTGTAVIVSHGRGSDSDVPFLKGTNNTMCSDFYDFFVMDGTGLFDISLPIDANAGCETNTAGGTAPTNIVWMFPTTGVGAPDDSCSPDTACWIQQSGVTRSGSSGSYSLSITGLEAGVDLAGTPITTGDTNGDGPGDMPLAVTLSGLQADGGIDISVVLVIFAGLLLTTIFFVASRQLLVAAKPQPIRVRSYEEEIRG